VFFIFIFDFVTFIPQVGVSVPLTLSVRVKKVSSPPPSVGRYFP